MRVQILPGLPLKDNMKIEVIESKPVSVIKDIVCDCCGGTCRDSIDMNYEFLKMEAKWGYGSEHDQEKWVAYVCESCVEAKLDFIKFQKTEYLI